MAYTQKYYYKYPPQQSVTFHNLKPGIKYRIRVRAVDGEGNIGAYSNPVDIIAGIGSENQLQVVDPNLQVADAEGGVIAEYNEVEDTRYHGDGVARGYELYATESSTDPPPDPDHNPYDPKQLKYRGTARKVFIKAVAGNYVKVLLTCYDLFGRRASNYFIAKGQAEQEGGGFPS